MNTGANTRWGVLGTGCCSNGSIKDSFKNKKKSTLFLRKNVLDLGSSSDYKRNQCPTNQLQCFNNNHGRSELRCFDVN